jgi:hypothetical protein
LQKGALGAWTSEIKREGRAEYSVRPFFLAEPSWWLDKAWFLAKPALIERPAITI